MEITVLYAGLLGLLHLLLTMRVIRGRQTHAINLGDGGNPEMERRIRGHANFVEYVPLILVLMLALENTGAAPGLIHGIGIILVVARGLHGYALGYTEKWFAGRFYGTLLTLIVLAVASLAAVYQGVTG